MEDQLYKIITLLIPAFPVLGFFIQFLSGSRIRESWSGILSSVWVFISFGLSVYLFWFVSSSAPLKFVVFDWINTSGFKVPFGFHVDLLSSIMMMLITGVGGLIHVYSTAYMHGDKDYNRFFSYLNLFVFFMLLLVMADNFIVLFAGWEGVGVCSYLLIGFWYDNTEYNKAANKALIINRIGDLALLLGIFMLFQQTSSFSFESIAQFFSQHSGGNQTSNGIASVAPEVLFLITILLFIGATGKSAQIPLFTWLPDAMAGPTPVSALIHAATMVTAGIYLILRNQFLFSLSPLTLDVIMYTGLITSLLGGIIALKQTDCKKILAYSTVSQLGLMFFALGLGAGNAAFFHLLTHAFFKALLFLAAGSVIHALHGQQDIRYMGALKDHIPVTRWVFFIGVMAIVAFPPFSGFFSKDAILMYAFQKNPVFWVLGLISGLITVWYMMRMYLLIFHGTSRVDTKVKTHIHESPVTMTLPMIILALLAFSGGVLNIPALFHGNHWLDTTLASVLKPAALTLSHFQEWVLMGITLIFILLISWLAIRRYHCGASVPDGSGETQNQGILLWVKHKFYIDELYDKIISKPVFVASGFLSSHIDKKWIDGIVEGCGKTIQFFGVKWRESQNGYISYYLFAMALGMLGILVIFIVF